GILAAASIMASLGIGTAHTAFPEKPITLVVGFAPGGPTDALARVLATEIGKDLGQSVVVDNKPGAGSNLAAQQVARAQPDGYTLLMLPVTTAFNQTLYADPVFALLTDLKPVAMAAKGPTVLVVNPALPVASVADVGLHAKVNPGKLPFG